MSRGLRALTACPGSAQPLVPTPTYVLRPAPGPGHLHWPWPPGGELLSPCSPGRKCPLPICDQPLITERPSQGPAGAGHTLPQPSLSPTSAFRPLTAPCYLWSSVLVALVCLQPLLPFQRPSREEVEITHAGQPTLLNREPLISCLRSSPDKPSETVLHHLPFLTQAPLPPWVRTGASHTETTATAEFRAACHPHSIHGAGRLPSLHWWGEVGSALQRGGQHLNPRLHSCELSPQSNPCCYLHLHSK